MGDKKANRGVGIHINGQAVFEIDGTTFNYFIMKNKRSKYILMT
jgi:uncharacterized protein YigE (DUF2233 family)